MNICKHTPIDPSSVPLTLDWTHGCSGSCSSAPVASLINLSFASVILLHSEDVNLASSFLSRHFAHIIMQAANTDLRPHQPMWINETFVRLFIEHLEMYLFCVPLTGGIVKSKSLQGEARGKRKLVASGTPVAGTHITFNLQFVLSFWSRIHSRDDGMCVGQHLRGNGWRKTRCQT